MYYRVKTLRRPLSHLYRYLPVFVLVSRKVTLRRVFNRFVKTPFRFLAWLTKVRKVKTKWRPL